MKPSSATLTLLLLPGLVRAAALDLTRATVLAPPGLTGPEAKAVQMLVEEVEKRSWVQWRRADAWPGGATPVIAVGRAEGLARLLPGVPLPAPGGPEGYAVGTADRGGTPVVGVAGHGA